MWTTGHHHPGGPGSLSLSTVVTMKMPLPAFGERGGDKGTSVHPSPCHERLGDGGNMPFGRIFRLTSQKVLRRDGTGRSSRCVAQESLGMIGS